MPKPNLVNKYQNRITSGYYRCYLSDIQRSLGLQNSPLAIKSSQRQESRFSFAQETITNTKQPETPQRRKRSNAIDLT